MKMLTRNNYLIHLKSKETPDIMEELSKNAHAAIEENLAYEKKAQ